MVFIIKLVENCLYFDAIHDFSVWQEPVLIHRILIGFEAILKYLFSSVCSSNMVMLVLSNYGYCHPCYYDNFNLRMSSYFNSKRFIAVITITITYIFKSYQSSSAAFIRYKYDTAATKITQNQQLQRIRNMR